MINFAVLGAASSKEERKRDMRKGSKWVMGGRRKTRTERKNNERGVHVNTQGETSQTLPQWTSLLLMCLRMQRLWKSCLLDEQRGLGEKWKWCLPTPNHWFPSGLDSLLSEMSPLDAKGLFCVSWRLPIQRAHHGHLKCQEGRNETLATALPSPLHSWK